MGNFYIRYVNSASLNFDPVGLFPGESFYIPQPPAPQVLAPGELTAAAYCPYKIPSDPAGLTWWWQFDSWVVVGGVEGTKISPYTHYAPQVHMPESGDVYAYAIYNQSGGPINEPTASVILHPVNFDTGQRLLGKAKFFEVTPDATLDAGANSTGVIPTTVAETIKTISRVNVGGQTLSFLYYQSTPADPDGDPNASDNQPQTYTDPVYSAAAGANAQFDVYYSAGPGANVRTRPVPWSPDWVYATDPALVAVLQGVNVAGQLSQLAQNASPSLRARIEGLVQEQVLASLKSFLDVRQK